LRRPSPHRRSAAIRDIATRHKSQRNDSKGQMGSLVQIRKQHRTRPQCTNPPNPAQSRTTRASTPPAPGRLENTRCRPHPNTIMAKLIEYA
jgi:hypothetical protein